MGREVAENASLAPTVLEYLADSYLLKSQAKLLKCASDERGPYVVFDKTIFYPQGGGQPTDTGSVEANGEIVPIAFVAKVADEVFHYTEKAVDWPEGTEVSLTVDELKRRFHARLHTAGHLISHVIETLLPQVKAEKGYHFPDSPYVELSGECDLDQKDSLLETINERVAAKIEQSLATHAEIDLNARRHLRIGQFEPVACGGTHVNNLGELGVVQVTRVKRKRGNLRFSYQLRD